MKIGVVGPWCVWMDCVKSWLIVEAETGFWPRHRATLRHIDQTPDCFILCCTGWWPNVGSITAVWGLCTSSCAPSSQSPYYYNTNLLIGGHPWISGKQPQTLLRLFFLSENSYRGIPWKRGVPRRLRLLVVKYDGKVWWLCMVVVYGWFVEWLLHKEPGYL